MDAQRAHRYWASMFIACSVLCLTGAVRADEESTEALYARWAAQYDGKSEYPKSDQTAPLFLELLGRKDADTFFIRGTRAKSRPVGGLSWFALSQLKTDQWFDILTQLAHHSYQSNRLSAVYALAEFREPRCIPILLNVLQKDKEDTVRRETARVLRFFPDEKVTTALLETLKNDPPAAGYAARTLAELNVQEAIEPTHQAMLTTTNYHSRADMLTAFCFYRRKEAVALLVELHETLPKMDTASGRARIAQTDWYLKKFVQQAYDVCGPVPETGEQWREWWKEAEPLFTEDMQLKKPVEVRTEDLGQDASQLEFRIALDAMSYRIADPIAIDFFMHNRSQSPLRTIPCVKSGWRSTMAYGIRLQRLDEPTTTLFESEPSGYYMGSYAGPPEFETLVAGQTISRRDCLHDWIGWQTKSHWPLPEGKYRLTITFDNHQYPGASLEAKQGDLLHRWQAPPVEFAVQGEPRTEPTELLGLIAEKSKLRFLATDLDSKNENRSRRARWTISRWGDDRLAPLLGDKFREAWGSALPHYEPLPLKDSPR